MKRFILVLLCVMLASCVHVDRTTSHPIDGVLVDYDGRPIAGAQVWALCQLPGGLFAAPRNTSWGPSITDAAGNFKIEMTPVSMIQTGTIFDGSTTPSILVVLRDRGCFMIVSTKGKKDLGFMRLNFPEPHGPPSFSMIDELDVEDQAVARTYVYRH
jgi:hypothetical protein